LADISALCLQETAKQNSFKLSYYVPLESNTEALLAEIESRLVRQQIRASLTWSIDELEHEGLLGVLPENATKLHAIELLIKQKSYAIFYSRLHQPSVRQGLV